MLRQPRSGWRMRGFPAMSAGMTKPNPMAGGFFLVLPIVAGFFWGLTTGRAAQGVLVGLGVGLVLALLVWLVDRARQRR